jgi:hypothetical protein
MIPVIEQRGAVGFENIYGCICLRQYAPDMLGLDDAVYPREDLSWGEIAWEANHSNGDLVWLNAADFVGRITGVSGGQ